MPKKLRLKNSAPNANSQETQPTAAPPPESSFTAAAQPQSKLLTLPWELLLLLLRWLPADDLAPGLLLPAEQLAFTQTTEAGAALAERYVGRPDFLVYDGGGAGGAGG